MNDTIVAIATPIGISGVGVVRFSGPKALRIARKIWFATRKQQIKPRYMHLGWLKDENGREIDQAILVYMPKPNSYTGEEIVELQTHGSPAVLDWIIETAQKFDVRLAEPGEFTKRAYLNDKLGLTQAEAVNDVIHAKSLAAVRAASDQLAGSLSSSITRLRLDLVKIFAAETASLDFSEEDTPTKSDAQLRKELNQCKKIADGLLVTEQNGVILRQGITAVLAGIPNAGKSTLLNSLLGYKRAIVTNIAGTTRDHIEETIVIDGIPVRVIDTAGLTESNNQVEQIGVRKSRDLLKNAAINILVIPPKGEQKTKNYLAKNTTKIKLDKSNTIIVHSKQDLVKTDHRTRSWNGYNHILLSTVTNQGIADLKKAMLKLIKSGIAHEEASISASRHVALLRQSSTALTNAIGLIKNNQPRDIVLVEINSAIQALNQLEGTDIEQAKLDELFANFCIGK